MAHFRQRRFNVQQAVCLQQLVRHARLLQYRDIAGRVFELLVGAEKLQRAALPAFILDTGALAQRLQAVAAVLRQAHHTSFVFHIVASVAVAQHLPHPFQLERRAIQPNSQRRVALEHPLNRLQRYARRRPRRSVAGRDLPGVSGAGLFGRPRLTIDNRHFMSCLA